MNNKTGLTSKQIKKAVDNSQIVHWANNGYTVKRSNKGDYYIQHHSGSYIGLTWLDGVTLNGKPEEFYIAQ